MKWAELGITARLILTLSICGGLIFAVVFTVNDLFTSRMVEQQVMAHSRDVVMAAVSNIDKQLRDVEWIEARVVDRLESSQRLSAAGLKTLLEDHLTINDEVFGATAAFEPAFSPIGNKLYAPYISRRLNGKLVHTNLAVPTYNYPAQAWYIDPQKQHAPVWSEPYFDDGGGNVVMTTYSAPFYRLEKRVRRFAGVATSDISTAWLGKQVSSLKLHRNGYAALFSRKGVYLAHPDHSLVMKETIFSVAERMGNPALKEIGLAIARQETGFVRARNIYGKESWIYYAPVPANGWSLAVVFPAEEMRADAIKASRMIVLLCSLGIFLLVLSIVLVARSVTRPLAEMTLAIERIAGGDLDGELPAVRIGGEVAALAHSVTQMQHDLKEHIRQLVDTTAAKERMAGELAIAHDMQMTILPRNLPSLPEIETAGLCLPAREVGGDFYDVSLLADGRLFFIIGDVSGKGVPAALYMAMATTLARSGARDGCGPEEVLERINRELCQGNEACMFATILCGIIDPLTGAVHLANAGHTPPVIIKADGTSRFVRLAPGLVTGYSEDFCFTGEDLQLAPGDSLLMYTDGVTEAMDAAGELFGEERLLAALSIAAPDVVGLTAAIESAVAGFAQEAPQADDITLLAIRYHR